MSIRPSACILLLVSSVCAAQESERSPQPAPAIVVNGVEVNAGPFSSTLEAFWKAFNPGRENVRWPLYAYDISQLGYDFCQEHGEKLSASGAAFVGPVSSGLTDRSPRYTGIQITDTSWFVGACTELLNRQENFERVLDDYLFSIEGFGEHLHGGRLARIEVDSPPESHDSAGTDNVGCVRQITSGILSDASVSEHEGLWWIGRSGNSEHDPIALTWSTNTNSVHRTITEMIESLSEGAEMWQFTPRDPEQLGGHFLISFNASSRPLNPDSSITSLWNGGDIEWEGMSGDDYYRNGHFDMWYFPPFCGASVDDSWYLVSKFRLGFDRDLGFRARLVPLRPAAMDAAFQR